MGSLFTGCFRGGVRELRSLSKRNSRRRLCDSLGIRWPGRFSRGPARRRTPSRSCESLLRSFPRSAHSAITRSVCGSGGAAMIAECINAHLCCNASPFDSPEEGVRSTMSSRYLSKLAIHSRSPFCSLLSPSRPPPNSTVNHLPCSSRSVAESCIGESSAEPGAVKSSVGS